MGEVFLAVDPELERQVAVKTILGDRSISQDAQERFLREAKAAGALSHPNLVTVHEFGLDQGTRYMVMEYLPGQDLRVFLSARTLAPAEVLEVLAQVCDGLAHAHARGILHRDIKPSNLRVWRDGRKLHVKIMDFGLARVPDSDLTATGAVMGTFAYMAPETLATGRSDARSDTYAVGVILFEALKGVRPMLAPTMPQGSGVMAPAPGLGLPEGALTGISSHTWDIVVKAMTVDPELRFQSAQDLASALRAAQDPVWPGFAAGRANGEATTGNIVSVSVHPPDSRWPTSDPSGPRARPVPVQIPKLWVQTPPEPVRKLDGWTLGLLGAAGVGLLVWWSSRSAPLVPTDQGPAPILAQAASPAIAQRQSAPLTGTPASASTLPMVPARATALGSSIWPPERPPAPRPEPPAQAADRPANPPPASAAALEAHARTLAELYHQGRYGELAEGFRKARSEGATFDQLMQVQAFRDFMQEEERGHRIPPLDRRSLEPYLPPPRAGVSQRPQDSSGQWPQDPR